MTSNNSRNLPLNLPEWNQGLLSMQHQFDANEPQGKPTIGAPRRVFAAAQEAHAAPDFHHQKAVQRHEPNALLANGLSALPTAKDADFWLHKAAAQEAAKQLKEAERTLMEALERDAQPVTPIACALHRIHKKLEEAEAAGKEDPQPAAPAAAESGFQAASCAPAVVFAPASVEPPHSTRSTLTKAGLTPSRTGLSGKAVRVPSRLAATPGAAKSASAQAAPPTKFHGILKKLEYSTAPPPETTIKRLHFGDQRAKGCTPATGTTLPDTSTRRRVTFGAGTVSPGAARPRHASFAFDLQTPVIAEAPSDEEAAGEGTGGTVNSYHAGSTPFDRRLSSLFAKYGDDGEEAAGGEDAAEVEVEGEGEGKEARLLPRWNGLSPARESIRALAGKDGSGGEKLEGEKKSEEESEGKQQQSQEAVGGGLSAAAPQQANRASAPTPPSPTCAAASVLGALLRGALADIQAAKAADTPVAPRFLHSGVISPTTGVLALSPTALAAPRAAATAEALEAESPSEMEVESQGGWASGRSNIDLSPERGSLTPASPDDVPRDRSGIPLLTPGTVTLHRGAAAAGRRLRDDGIVADLSRSFTTPPGGTEDDKESGGKGIDPGFSFSVPGTVLQNPAYSDGTASSMSTPDFPPKAASTPAAAAAASTAVRTPATAAAAATAVTFPAPGAERSLGKAQRVPGPSPSPRSATKELRGLMHGMALSPAAGGGGGNNGTDTPNAVPALAIVKSTRAQRAKGASALVATPVRRSPRLAGGSAAAAPALLEATGFSYAANPAFSPNRLRQPMQENCSAEDMEVSGGTAEKKTPQLPATTAEKSGATPPPSGRRYATRSASKVEQRRDSTGSKSSSGKEGLKLSPTEQKIRDSLRSASSSSSSRRKSALAPSN